MKRSDKSGQMKLSFGMIVSIFLIIIFISFAFYGIKKFMEWGDTAKIAMFKEDLQEDINARWKASQGSEKISYNIPSKIKRVCFVDDSYENFVLYSSKGYEAGYILENINFDKTLEPGGNLCFNNLNEKIEILIKKEFGESLVSLERGG